MEQKKRLVELLKNAQRQEDLLSYDLYDLDHDTGCAEDFADYLMSNNVVVLPMKLGQICYEPLDYRNSIDECRVSSLTQKADGSFKIRLTNLRGKWVFEITEDEIGKTVFLSREEAENVLKERNNAD
jgi:hypothetical protein